MKLLCSFLIVFFSFSYSIGQSKLIGVILDAASKKPVSSANVFLSNTSLGTVSNDKGEFIIEHIPFGKYELVVSSMSYKNTVTQIQLNKLLENITVSVQSSANELAEVVVESYETDGWEKWGEYFSENFLGKNSLVKNCKLKNPDVVKFKLNKKTNTVRAFAHENLIFENNTLGYNISYLLMDFEYNLNENSFKFIGYPLFQEIASDDGDKLKQWKSARLDTYKGSLMYFIRSLFNDVIDSSGYEIQVLKKIDDQERTRVKRLYKIYLEEKKTNSNTSELKENSISKDSLEYYTKVYKLPNNEYKVTFDRKIKRDELVFKLDASVDTNAYFFEFDDYLHVSYLHKKEPYEYTKHLLKRPYKDAISSDLSLPFQKGVTIYKNGSYFFGENIFVEGYWAWSEKLSTMLPYNYDPNN